MLMAKIIKRKALSLFLSMLLGLAICYLFGTLWYVCIYAENVGFFEALVLCVLPFILPDILKILLAILLIKKLPLKL